MDPRTQIFQAQRGRLLGIGYRLLGSTAEAEDVLQDACCAGTNPAPTACAAPRPGW